MGNGSERALQTIFADSGPTALRIREARLIVASGPSKGTTAVVDKHRTFVGRGQVNDLVLDDTEVSLRHVEIEVTEEGYLLRDLRSTNGTFFEGARVRELFLEAGRGFRIGHSEVRLDTTTATVDIPLSAASSFGEVAGVSLPMREIFALMEKVAPSDLTVLIAGETGTGKERLARSIHQESARRSGPYVVLDCSSIPRELAESTVFGHEKGAFTGATTTHMGVFEQADGGTIFLDEVGELELSLQPKLLRVLENREVRRVGSDRVRRVDVRVVAATNRDLRQMVADGTFREDLFFRLSVIQCELPPLRARAADLEILIEQLLTGLQSHRPDLSAVRLSADAMARLRSHAWPGNVRELKNVLERAVSLTETARIDPSDLSLGDGPRHVGTIGRGSLGNPRADDNDAVRVEFDISIADPFKTAKAAAVERFEAIYLKRLVASSDGNLSRAAESIGLTRYHLRELLKKHGLLESFRDGDR